MESVHLGRDNCLLALEITCVQLWVFPLDFLDDFGFSPWIIVAYFNYDFRCYTGQNNTILTFNHLHVFSYAIPDE
jgi:hypothetical protein